MRDVIMFPIYFDCDRLPYEALESDEEENDERSGDVPRSPSLKKPKNEEEKEEKRNEQKEKEEEESDSDDDGLTEEQREQFSAYQDHVHKYHGFHVDMTLCPKDLGIIGGIIPVDFEISELGKEHAWNGARLAIDAHNATSGNQKLRLVDLIRANRSSILYYITLVAEELSSGETANYQALVSYFRCGDADPVHKVYFLRPEPERQRIIEE